MSALAILVILSSGFIFTSHYPLARLKQIHSTGWALYLHSFIWGLAFSGISLVATELLERKEKTPLNCGVFFMSVGTLLLNHVLEN